ncbi:MAG TPA: DUF1080 domain-containing protein [Vicinamibacteria bacterium]|nr:DUF1080 domain-containing protein [Vicinamibacteria bacterium]
MRRVWIVTALAFASCAPPPPPAPSYDPGILGRWDATVSGEDSYPLWFEISEGTGGLEGRLQGRFGHALDLESIEASGTHLTMMVDGTTYHANLEGSSWKGTGEPKEGASFDWTAVRAPALAARAEVSWGEPLSLFNGTDLSGWVPRHASQPNRWTVQDGTLVNEDSGSDLMTEASFQDFQLHAEVMVPEGSNSGIYLRGRYEVQVQDDYGKEPHARGMGGIYGQVTPAENAALPAGEWQTFDITLLGRTVTVVLNGKTIIEAKEIPGTTGGALDSREAEPGPIFLQGDHGRILYRNLVLIPAL